MISKHKFRGFISLGKEDGCLYGFLFDAKNRMLDFEPGSPSIESALEDVCIGIACGDDPFSDNFAATPGYFGALGAAKRLCGRECKERYTWYFEVDVEIDDKDDPEWVYRIVRAHGDKDVHGLEVDLA